jgi:hypothetical protein
MYQVIIEFICVFLAGILAGEEFVIYYGVRVPMANLDEKPQIQLRQALVRRLRVLVPAIFVPTAASGVAVYGYLRARLGIPVRRSARLAHLDLDHALRYRPYQQGLALLEARCSTQ